jgi:murein tripeptide amidase MpaA
VASDDGALDPAAARARAKPVVLFQGGIHAGEIDGKDAGFIALREILEGKSSRGALARTTVLFVPVFNVDGHERFGAWNRPNQRGPEEMGWRATAQNLNLNRDYMKVEAPEMRAMMDLLRQWDPILYADLHVTDGAELREDVSVEIEPAHGSRGARCRDRAPATRRFSRHAVLPGVRRGGCARIGRRG